MERRAIGVLALMLLAACQQEPDFDERFEKASIETRQLADEINKELDAEKRATSPIRNVAEPDVR